jgi:hypothetical protein
MAEITQPSLQDVEGQIDLGMAEVRRVVGRNATAVERDEGTCVDLEEASASSIKKSNAH